MYGMTRMVDLGLCIRFLAVLAFSATVDAGLHLWGGVWGVLSCSTKAGGVLFGCYYEFLTVFRS